MTTSNTTTDPTGIIMDPTKPLKWELVPDDEPRRVGKHPNPMPAATGMLRAIRRRIRDVASNPLMDEADMAELVKASLLIDQAVRMVEHATRERREA